MQPSEYLLIRTQVQPWKVEEGNGVAVANIKEKMGRPLVIAVLKDVGQGEFQKVLIKPDGPLHVGTEQGHMVHPAGGGRGTCGASTEIRRAQPGSFGGKGGEIEFWHRVLLSEKRAPPAL